MNKFSLPFTCYITPSDRAVKTAQLKLCGLAYLKEHGMWVRPLCELVGQGPCKLAIRKINYSNTPLNPYLTNTFRRVQTYLIRHRCCCWSLACYSRPVLAHRRRLSLLATLAPYEHCHRSRLMISSLSLIWEAPK